MAEDISGGNMSEGKKGVKTVVKSASWYTISALLLRGVSIITAPIFTRLLSTSDYGLANNFTTWTQFISCISGLGLSTAILRGKVEFDRDYKQYLSSVQFLGFVFAGILLLIAIPFSGVLADFMNMDQWLVIVLFVYLLVYPSVSYMRINYRFEYRYKTNIFVSVIATIGNVFTSIILILVFSNVRYVGRILGSVIPMFVMGLIFFIQIAKEGKTGYNRDYWIYALRLGIPLIPHSLAMIVLGQIDRVMIIKMCGSSQAGIYGFAYSYATIISLLTHALNEAIQPIIYSKLKQESHESINSMTFLTTLGILCAGFLMILLVPETFKILGTKAYYEGVYVVFPVIIGSAFQYMYQNYACVEIYYKKSIWMAVGSMLAALINAGLNYILIPRYGYMAAGYTTGFGYLFLAIFHYIGARITSGKKIYRLDHMIFFFIVGTLGGLFCHLLIDQSIFFRLAVSFLICMGLLAMAFYFKKRYLDTEEEKA